MNLLSRLFGPPVPSLDAPAARDRMMKEPKPLVLDVRQPEEFRSGHISGAMLIPLGELKQRLNELPHDRDIVCVCASGSRSMSATHLLMSQDYKAVNLLGGMSAWAGAGLPVQRG